MRKLAKWGLCALALVAAFGLGRGDRVYTEIDLARAREDAYNSGYHAGYDVGLAAEQSDLYDQAFAAGRSEGYDTGYTEGVAEGAVQGQQSVLSAVGDTYTQGYDTGYSEGYAQKEKDAQAAQQQYLASLTPVLPSAITVSQPAASDSSSISDQAAADAAQEEQVTVYITNSGSKYHLDGCQHLKSKIEKTLAEAKALKLEPCKVCNPPK